MHAVIATRRNPASASIPTHDGREASQGGEAAHNPMRTHIENRSESGYSADSGTAASAAAKPIFDCVPSQKGLILPARS